MEVTTTKLLGEASAQQIEEWKTKHPDGVHQVTLRESVSPKMAQLGMEGKPFALIYLKEPDDIDYGMIMGLLTMKQTVKAGELALQQLYLGGHVVDQNDRKLHRSACMAALSRLDFYETESVKL